MVTPKKAKQYLDQLSEFNADPQVLLMELDRIRSMCIDGYRTEKATVKGEVVELVEKDVRTAVAAIKETRELVKMLITIAGSELEDTKDYQFNLTVITSPPGIQGYDSSALDV